MSKVVGSLKRRREAQDKQWDFIALLNKDIREIEFSRMLKKLGNIRVMEWDFRSALPAVNELANREVNIVDIIRQTANYKVLEWEFRRPSPAAIVPEPEEVQPAETPRNCDDLPALTERLKKFLQYVAVSLIDEPNHAQIKILEIAPNVLRFKLVLVNRDVAMLIGRQGHTAAAIRNMLKTAAALHGVHALLQIHSHEEEMAITDKSSL